MSRNKYGVPLPDIRPSVVQPKPKNRFRIMLYGFAMKDNNDERQISFNTDNVTKPEIEFDLNEYTMYNSKTYDHGIHTWKPIELSIRDSVDNASLKSVANQILMMMEQKRFIGRRQNTKFEMWIQTMGGGDTTEINGADSLLGDDFDKTIEKYRDQLVDGALTIAAPVAGEAVSSAASGLGGQFTDDPTAGVIGGVAGGLAEGYIEGLKTKKKPYEFFNTVDTWVLQGCVISNAKFGDVSYADSDYMTIDLTIQPDNCFLLDENGVPIIGKNDSPSFDSLENLTDDFFK